MASRDEMVSWDGINKAVKHYAVKRDAVMKTVDELESACRALVAKRSNGLKLQVEAMVAAKAALHDAIWESPEFFEEPKTQTAHGVKFGYRKAADRYEYDEAKTLTSIERAGGAFAELLIKRTPRVVKGSLRRLDEAQLKRFKVRKVVGESEVMIKDERGDAGLGFVGVLMKD